MKRFFLLFGVAIILLPTPSRAADSAICNALKNVTPVSTHYVQKVLERANAGLAKAKGSEANPGLEIFYFSWAERIGAAANSLIDSYLTLTVAQRDLMNTTSCLHVDILLIDCKINETQKELQAQLGKKSILGIVRLEALLEFLLERKTPLVRRALNQNFENPTWETEKIFDKAKTEEEKKNNPNPQPLCPFDSDYAPPASDGYGCDSSILAGISAYAPAREEMTALARLDEELKKYKGLATEFDALERDLNALYENNGPQETSAAEEKKKQGHQELNGCANKEKPAPDNLRLRSVRSPFSYKKNDLAILTEFLGKRAAEGMFRLQEGALRNADEIEDTKAREDYEKNDNVFSQLIREAPRAFFQMINGEEDKKEGTAFDASPDSTIEIPHALGDLRTSVSELSRLSGKDGEKEGLRAFVIRFAYFLRRSCVFRPCNESLERIMRIAYADECFPYTDGDFVTQEKDETSDPQWKKCAIEACIQLPDVTLPASCKDVLPQKP